MSYLNNEKLFYSYGQAWGEVSLEGEVLLGSSDIGEGGIGGAILDSAGNGLRLVELYFDLFRASSYKLPVILSALRYAKPIKFYLTSYSRGRVNPEFNTVSFALQGVAVEPNNSTLLGRIGSAFTGL
jgi:hypothetical protein